MPETINPMFHRTPADVIACPDPACGAPARIVDRWNFESTAARSSTSRPAASAATGSRRRSIRSTSNRFPPGPARRWRPPSERANRTHR